MIVLVVDDISLNRKLLRAQLESEGITVVEAAEGRQGLGILEEIACDAIISDVLMPVMDGYRFLHEVRANPKFCSIPFLIFTNTFTSPSDEKVALDMGADRFLKKPSEVAEVCAALQALVSAPPSRKPTPFKPSDEVALMKEYSEQLIAKLEEKNLQLEARTRDLSESQALVFLQAAALSNAANAVLITDPQGVILWVNPAFTLMSGFSADEAIGKTPRILKSGSHDQAFYKKLWAAILSGKTWQGELINRRKDGALYYGDATLTPVRVPGGPITHFVGIMNDVTQRKLAEEQLADAREKLQHVIDHTPAVLYRLRIEGDSFVPFFVSQSVTRLLGFTIAETMDPAWWDSRVHPDDLFQAIASQRSTVSVGTSHGEYRLRGKDDRFRWVESHRRLVRDPNGVPTEIAGMLLDVTERKDLENQLRQSQKMEAVGQLAGGVAHDFNNILTVINGYSDILLHDPGTPADSVEMLKQVYIAGERAGNLTRQLLTFSRKQFARIEPLDLNAIVADLAKMLQRLLPASVALQICQHPELPSVTADAGMMEQVVVNLVVNARDAMPNGGKLIVSTGVLTIGVADPLPTSDAYAGDFVRLSVQDTGSGIAPENLPRIFEPFFTTKEPGKGTGLGLATLFGIVKQHHGWVTVDTKVGVGTTFHLFFPVDAAGTRKSTANSARPVLAGGNETILIVEDEAPVRGLAVVVLQKLGYRVLEAVDGDEAVEVWERHRSHIDLLLTDMVMPGALTGRKLAEKFQSQKPDLRVIYSSGYDSATAGQIFDIRQKAPFLQKPYHPRRLAEIVRNSLDRPFSRTKTETD
jgi:two-component system cell cycle sensor histidine kinase/response regulator CckA